MSLQGWSSSWRRLGATALLLVVAGVTVGGLLQVTFNTSVATFLGPHDQARQAYATDEKKFGADPVTVVIRRTDGARLLTTALLPRIIHLEGQLSNLPGVTVVYGPGTVLNQLAGSAADVLSDISFKRQEVAVEAERTARAAGKSDKQVAAAKAAALRRYDLRYGVLLTKALPAGLPTLSNQSFVNAVAFDGDQPRPTLRFVAPDDHTIAIIVRPQPELSQGRTRTLVAAIQKLVGATDLGPTDVKVSGSPVVLAALVSQTRKEIPPLTVASLVVVAIILFVGVRRQRGRQRWFGILVPLAATGWAVLVDLALLGWLHSAASLVLVAVLPALIGIGSDVPIYLGRFGPTRRVVVTALATASGFAVAALSPIPFVRQLGGLLAIGVLVAGLLAHLLRVVLDVAPVEPAHREDDVAGSASAEAASAGRTLTARSALAVMAVLAVVGWVLLPTIPLDADLAGLADGLPVQADAKASQTELGVSGEVDVLLEGSAATPQALDWSDRARSAIVAEHGDQLRTILSTTDLLGFLGAHPTTQQISSALALVPSYLVGAVLTPDGTTASLSFGVVPSDIGEQRTLVREVQRLLPPPPAGDHVVVTGVPAVGAREVDLLDSSRLWSNLLGVLAPSVVLLLLLGRRHWTDAVQALVAASVATGLGLLALKVSGASLTPLTCALGSLTAAVGCEFTVILRHRAFPWRSVLVAGSTSISGYLVLFGSRLDVMHNFALVLALSVVWAGLSSAVVALALPRRARPEAGDHPDAAPDDTDDRGTHPHELAGATP